MLVKDLWNLEVTYWGVIWLIGLTASTYLFAGFIKERVCLYMCPYGRFQSAMLDNDSSIVEYHSWRGEPRGKYDPKKYDPNSNLGDCIDCGKCVVVCPMGIDIRNGLQLACIGCGLCVDACNSVMERIGRPLDLICYDSVNSTQDKMQGKKHNRKLLHTKTILFGLIFTVIAILLIYLLANKEEFKLVAIHDRAPLFTLLPEGAIRNSYTLKLSNKSNSIQKFVLCVKGIEGASLKLQGFDQQYDQSHNIEVALDAEVELLVFVKISKDLLKSSRNSINFEVTNIDNNKTYSVNTVFISD